jgi:methyl-accepting chemotaxis protein
VAGSYKTKQSIRVRILAIVGVLATGYLLLLAMAKFTAGATRAHMDQLSISIFPAALKLREAQASFEQMTRSYKEAVLLEDPKTLAAADVDAGSVEESLTTLREDLDGSPELAHNVDDLLTQFTGIRSRSRETYAALLASRDNATTDLQGQVFVLAADDRNLAAAMLALDQSIGVQFRGELDAIDLWTNRSRVADVVMLMVALIGCAGAWWVLQYKVLLPLDRLARRMRDIAEGDGDLTGRLEVRGHDELDEVGRWFNVFIERIEQIVLRVTQNAAALGEAATGLAKIAHETASQSAKQHDQAMHITASMGEISTAVRQISETTQSAARDARKAEENAHSGGNTIQSTVATIQQLLVANQATATKIGELGLASDAIGTIIGVIDDIANQTSLLALNASIESARAGEHGRGFAVVAAEVRRLAERTSRATKEIDQTVRAIQAGTAEVVEAMRTSMGHVEGGVGSARAAGDALARIIQGSEAVQKMVTQIATASTQQSYATQSVNTNLSEISSIIEATTNSSALAVDACDRLSHLAADLNQLVGSFKVRDELNEPEEGKGASGDDGVVQQPPGSLHARTRGLVARTAVRAISNHASHPTGR